MFRHPPHNGKLKREPELSTGKETRRGILGGIPGTHGAKRGRDLADFYYTEVKIWAEGFNAATKVDPPKVVRRPRGIGVMAPVL